MSIWEDDLEEDDEAADDAPERVFHSIRERFGEQVSERLQDAFAGRTLWVPAPENLVADSELIEALGMETATLVSEMLAVDGTGLRFYVPLLERKRHSRIDARIKRLLAEGLSILKIARKLNLSERTVYRRKKKFAEQGSP